MASITGFVHRQGKESQAEREATLGAMFPPEWPVAAVSSHLLEFATRQARSRLRGSGRGARGVGNQGFKDLLVWQLAKDLAVRVYQVSESQELKKDFGLRDQIRRSAVSVASNLAEGDERGSDREAIRFFHIAKGSVAEVRTQIQIACEAGCLSRTVYENLETEYLRLAKMIGSLIRSRKRSSRP